MDRINYDQTEGFPLDVNILDFGQKANQITQHLGNVIAPLAIVSGCVENGNNVSDGIVYINGEILSFKGGLKQSAVRIVEASEARVFENGNSKPVLITRYATFGLSAALDSYNWADFHRPKTLQQLEANKAENDALKKLIDRVVKLEVFARPFSTGGGMVFFNRPVNEIPEGWREVENWRGRIPMHIDPTDVNLNFVGKEYGSKTRQLTAENLPSFNYANDYFEQESNTWSGGGGSRGSYTGYAKSKTSTYNGASKEFSIMPPVKIAIFIEPIP